jgi:hypothetical protein
MRQGRSAIAGVPSGLAAGVFNRRSISAALRQCVLGSQVRRVHEPSRHEDFDSAGPHCAGRTDAFHFAGTAVPFSFETQQLSQCGRFEHRVQRDDHALERTPSGTLVKNRDDQSGNGF